MKKFSGYSDAFDYCREVGKPVSVSVDGEPVKIFPSGRSEQIQPLPLESGQAQRLRVVVNGIYVGECFRYACCNHWNGKNDRGAYFEESTQRKVIDSLIELNRRFA